MDFQQVGLTPGDLRSFHLDLARPLRIWWVERRIHHWPLLFHACRCRLRCMGRCDGSQQVDSILGYLDLSCPDSVYHIATTTEHRLAC